MRQPFFQRRSNSACMDEWWINWRKIHVNCQQIDFWKNNIDKYLHGHYAQKNGSFQNLSLISPHFPHLYPHFTPQEMGGNRVIHKVIHIIHIFWGKCDVFKKGKTKQMFCNLFIKWTGLRKNGGKCLTLKISKICRYFQINIIFFLLHIQILGHL